MNADKISYLIAERVREIATRQGNIPFLKGDLRKSIVLHYEGQGKTTIGSNLPYARAVHDGRPAITITPNINKNPPRGYRKHKNPNRATLKFTIGGKVIFAKKVHQKKRKGKPFIKNAITEMKQNDFAWLEHQTSEEISRYIEKQLKA